MKKYSSMYASEKMFHLYQRVLTCFSWRKKTILKSVVCLVTSFEFTISLLSTRCV